jgi:hypothetical protein
MAARERAVDRIEEINIPTTRGGDATQLKVAQGISEDPYPGKARYS